MAFTLITGASAGIGRAFAEIAAASGRNVILNARSRGDLEALAGELREAHAVEAVVLPGDLSEPGAAEALWAEAAEGREIDVLVNNAGFGHAGPFGGDLEKEQRMIRLNVAAAAELAARAAAHMLGHGQRSRIINLSSLAGYSPGPGMAVYHASKAFLQSLSFAQATELRGTNVSVTAVAPGGVSTKFQEAADLDGTELTERMSRTFMTADEVARAGWAAAISGDRVVVPGAMNKASAVALRLLPWAWSVPALMKLYKRT